MPLLFCALKVTRLFVEFSVKTLVRWISNAAAVRMILLSGVENFMPASYSSPDSGATIPCEVASELKFVR